MPGGAGFREYFFRFKALSPPRLLLLPVGGYKKTPRSRHGPGGLLCFEDKKLNTLSSLLSIMVIEEIERERHTTTL